MKKEFKAPIVEARELNTITTVMADAMLISANAGTTGLATYDDTVTKNYNMWKGKQQ